MAITKACSCKHEYQDKTYGKGIRIHNAMIRGGSIIGWRCTVCGSEKKIKEA